MGGKPYPHSDFLSLHLKERSKSYKGLKLNPHSGLFPFPGTDLPVGELTNWIL